MNLGEAKAAYSAAQVSADEALKVLMDSMSELYQALLAEKGLKMGQTCRLVDPKGKEQVGVFRLVEQSTGIAFRFFAYKKDATLSGNPSAFNFGVLPDVSWEAAGISGVRACEPPVPPEEDV